MLVMGPEVARLDKGGVGVFSLWLDGALGSDKRLPSGRYGMLTRGGTGCRILI